MPIVFSFLVIVMVVLFAAWLWDFDPGAAQRSKELQTGKNNVLCSNMNEMRRNFLT